MGWIRDSVGNPIAMVDVEVGGAGNAARTDSSGRFALRGLPVGNVTVRLRRLGFGPQSFEFLLHEAREDSVAVTLREQVQVLAVVETDALTLRHSPALEGFYRRRALGSGSFITRADIERHHTNVLSETLREVPGLRMVRTGAGRSGLRFDSSNSKRYDCPPQYWLDGRRMTGVDIDDFPASDVEAVELYKGPSTTPMQFSQGAISACGTVVIWTRVPGTRNH